jgi:hypothetical protein
MSNCHAIMSKCRVILSRFVLLCQIVILSCWNVLMTCLKLLFVSVILFCQGSMLNRLKIFLSWRSIIFFLFKCGYLLKHSIVMHSGVVLPICNVNLSKYRLIISDNLVILSRCDFVQIKYHVTRARAEREKIEQKR